MCIARNLRITLELLRSHAFQKYVRILKASTLCFRTSVSTHVRDLYIHIKFLRMTSTLTHGTRECEMYKLVILQQYFYGKINSTTYNLIL